MKRLCEVKDWLMDCVQAQMAMNMECIDTHELGEVIDMIKDIEQTMKYQSEKEYYDTVVKAMHEKKDSDMPVDANYVAKPEKLSADMYHNM